MKSCKRKMCPQHQPTVVNAKSRSFFFFSSFFINGCMLCDVVKKASCCCVLILLLIRTTETSRALAQKDYNQALQLDKPHLYAFSSVGTSGDSNLRKNDRDDADDDDNVVAKNGDSKKPQRNDIVEAFLRIVALYDLHKENCTPGQNISLGEGVVAQYGLQRFKRQALLAVNRANLLTRLWKYTTDDVDVSPSADGHVTSSRDSRMRQQEMSRLLNSEYFLYTQVSMHLSLSISRLSRLPSSSSSASSSIVIITIIVIITFILAKQLSHFMP